MTRQHIGPVIRANREARGMSLTELSRRTGISVSYLSRIEHGRSAPSFTKLASIANALDLDVDGLVATERDLAGVNQRLTWALALHGVPRKHWPALLGLEPEARRAMLTVLTNRVRR